MKGLPISNCRLPIGIQAHDLGLGVSKERPIGNRQLAIGNNEMETLLKDIRYAIRSLLKRPWFRDHGRDHTRARHRR